MGYYSLEPPVSVKLENEPTPLLVTPESPKSFRKFVEFYARCFKRELGFDFVQFCAEETELSTGYVPYEAYLFHVEAADLIKDFDDKRKNRAIGACCFRWIEWSDAPAGWILQWVYFHPYFRHRSHLSKSWSFFKQKYGQFDIEKPLSPAMAQFIESYRE